jgi:hypothetical protein
MAFVTSEGIAAVHIKKDPLGLNGVSLQTTRRHAPEGINFNFVLIDQPDDG